jgi:hypothetical protein
MSRFKIKVARIEAVRGSRAVSITFQIDRGAVNFQVPIHLDASDYDDTEPEASCIEPSPSSRHKARIGSFRRRT